MSQHQLIAMSQLKLKEIIGEGMCISIHILPVTLPLLLITKFEGEFGIVYRGLLYQDKIPKVVAVKTLKGTFFICQ